MSADTDYYHTNFVNVSTPKSGRLSANDLPEIEILLDRTQKDRESAWSAERLFAGAVNACLMKSFLNIARQSDIVVKDYVATAMVKMKAIEEHPQISEILIKPSITLTTKEDRTAAENILREARANDPFLRSIDVPVSVSPEWALLPER